MNKETVLNELQFKTARSSGAGGQHVNKVSTKVILSFDVTASEGLSIREKKLLYQSIASRLVGGKTVVLSCDKSRSQLQNKTTAIQRFFEIIEKGLFVPKRRLKAKPSKTSIKRVKDKKNQRGQLKQLRKKPKLE